MTGSPSDSDIHERIVAAILDQKLKPGTRLVEQQLAQGFGVSRTRIRPVLMRLAQEQLVTITPNRGAVVARPDSKASAEVFEVRALIEPVLLTRFIERADNPYLEQIEQSIAAEEQARREGDLEAAVRESGRFHLLIAQGSGHDTLHQLLRKMVSRTSLILMDQAPDSRARSTLHCGCTAHRGLLDCIRRGDVREAADRMREHLLELQAQCSQPRPAPRQADLQEILFSADTGAAGRDG